MKIQHVTISLSELQEALLDFCEKSGFPQPQCVTINSHNKNITVELSPGGIVDADEFRHRAEVRS